MSSIGWASASAEREVAVALGIDPNETAAGSLAITPLGAGFAVRRQGVKIMSRDEVLAALEVPDRTNRSGGIG